MRVNDWLLKSAVALTTLFSLTTVASAEVQPEAPALWGLFADFPRDVSVDGWRIDWLIDITMVFVIILFVIMTVWMLWACFFHGEDHEAEYDHGHSKHAVMVALVLSCLVFFIVDGNLFYNSLVDLEEVFWNYEHAENIEGQPRTECGSASAADGCAVRIEVNARQWAWQARYPGNDSEFNTPDDILVLNDIRVPAGAPVIVQLGSVDVIHSFYLPNLRMKMDAMPGMINKMWFEARPDGIGEFDIGCAQHCGTHHYKMKGKLTILAPEEYTAWATQASELARQAFDANDRDAQWGWAWKRG